MRLIDADKLIGDLHHHAFLEGDDRAIAYNVIQQQPTIGGWISVKDRLPERKYVDYLVATRLQTYGSKGINVAWLNDDNGVWKSNDEWICDGREIVTHWMPLPKPPEENEDEAN